LVAQNSGAVFTGQGWTPIDAPGGAVKQIWRAWIAKAAAQFRVFNLGKEAARRELFIVEQRLGPSNYRVGLAQKLCTLEQFVATVVLDPFIQYVEQMLGLEKAVHDLLVLGIGQVNRLAVRLDPFDERGPVAQRAMHDVAVAAFADPKKAALV